MATETLLKVRLLNASKTHAEWTSADPVLKKGEIAYSSDKKQIRVGDGSSKWSQLSYIDADHIVGFSNSGSTITYTKADGSTGTITLPEYDIATSSTPGLVKSGGNITVASDGTVTVNTATKANQVSGTAGSVNADRHVWFSDSVTETVRNYDDDFKYNPNTNTLKVTKIDGVELTGTPKAPTAASGTNSTQIATTAFVQNAVGNAEIGGRNLVKDSHKAVSNSSYATADYYFGDDPPLDGEEVTIQIKGQLADTKSYWNLYNSGGSINCFAVEKERYDATTGIYTDTGTWRVGTSSNTFMRIYAFTSSQSGTSTIEWVKLERGNKPTDWTPAPEDLVSDITLSGTTLSYKNPVGTQLGSYTLSKANVGLGNVDNTSDANKPISTATQNALDQLSAKVGNAKQFTGTCSSAADATAKVVTCTAFTADDLVKGTRISVYFDNTNTGAVGSLTLNVNSTGAKSIKYIYNGSYNNIPGAGYIKAGQIYNFTYDGTYWVVDMMYNTDTIPNHLRYYNNTYAKKAIAANKWIVGNKDGYEEVASGVTFDLSYPILYTSRAVSQGSSNYINMFSQFYDLNLTNLKSGFSSSAKKMIYLVVTVSGNIATVDPTIITDTLPTTDDGKVYITLGRLGAKSTGANYFLFQPTHPMFVYKKGAIRAYSGSADVVNGHTVEADVPSGAVFTDSKVTQNLTSDDVNYPLLLGKNNISNTNSYTDTVLRNNSIYANPKTGLVTTSALKSNNYLQVQNKIINVAGSYSSTNVDEIILYTGIKFVSSNLMPLVHITGFAYGIPTPIDLNIVFYIYNDKFCNQGVTDSGGWHPDVYLFKYTKNSENYVAIALRPSSYIYYPAVNADILNESLGKLTNIDPSLFEFHFIVKDATSVIPEPDNGVTCIQVPYKINYNPKPTLTIQGNSSTIGTYDGTNTATINITKSSIGLGNVENKSSATIRGELTSSNVTTALGYTPVNSNTTAYVYYGGNDQGLGSGTTAEKAKEYFADSSKVPAGMVKFFYNNSGAEFTTIFSKAPGSGYGSALKWGYQDQYLRILRYQANAWRTEDWEKIYAGYADSAGYTTSLRSSIVDINNGGNIDDLLTGSDLTLTKVSHSNIGWASNDGLILNIPWSTAFGRQIALDDNSNWMATRAKNNTNGWTAWDRIITKSYGDTIYLPLTGGTLTKADNVFYTASMGEVVKANPTSILQSPIPKYLWHDLWAFCRATTPKYYTTSDGTTWIEQTLNKELFAHKENIAQYKIINENQSGARWVWENGGFAYCNCAWLAIGVAYSANIAKFNVLLECSTGTGTSATWTTICESTNISVNQTPIWIKTNSTSNQNNLRLTITRSSDSDNTTTLPIVSLRLLSSRWGDQGRGSEYEYPYDWDGEKNITFLNNIIVVGALSATGGTLTGDLILQTSSGNSPAIIFQRGTYTDSLNDWEIRDKGGLLYFGQRGLDSTAFDTSIYLDNSGGIHASSFSGNVTGNATTSNATYELRQDSQYTYSNRRTSANIDSTNNGGLRTLLATSSMSAANGKPDYDAHIIHLDWDNSSTYSAQLAVGNKGVNGRIASRAQNADKTWTTWAYVYDTLHKPTASEVGALPLSGGTMTGPIKWTNSTALPQATSASYVVTIDAFADGGTQKWIYTSNLNVGSATTASYLTSNTSFDYANTGLSWFDIQGTAGAAVQANDTPTTAWWHVLRFNHQNSNPYYTDLAIPFNHPSIYYKRINNGTVSGNKWVKVLDEDNYSTYAIPLTQKGAASGVATLDTNTKVPIAQLPEVTTTTAGIMTAADKVKLNGIATNLVDGSAIGSLRGIYTTTESDTYTIGQYATALGNGTKASGNYSFAEGYGTTASGDISHVEGSSGTASGGVSHAEGFGTTSSGEYSHAEGYETVASGFYSHSQNYHTIAASSSQTALGKYNQSDANNVYAIILGNGTADNARSNALTIDWDGNLKTNGYLAGRNALYTLVSNPKGNDPESSIYTEYKIADSISDSETNYYGVFGTSISSNNVQTYMRAYKNVADSSDYIGFWLISPPSGESEAWLNAHNFHIGKKMYITGPTAESNAFDSDNPRLEFQNGGATQNLALVYTDYDSVQAPSSLTLIGNQGGEYFIAPNIKATGSFYGNLSGNATTASYLQGLSSRSTSAGWGNQNGTVLSCYSTSGGGGWVLRQNGGQMNMIIDGFYYQNEGNNLVLDTANYTSYVSKVRDIGNGTATTFKYSASGLNYADYTWLAGWNGYELRAVNKSQFLASTGGTLSGGLTVLKSSGESQIIASNGTNKLYIYANSDGRVGIYYNTANGSSGSIISRPNNSNVITLGNSKGGVLTYSYNYTSAPPVVSNTTNKNRVSHLAGHSSYMAVVLQLDATDYSNRTITLSGSDIRLKDNIKDPDLDALPIINSIQMHSFDWKDAHEYTHQPLGMVADELEKIDPRFAVGGGYDEDGIMCVKSVDTFYLVGYLVKAVQELSAEVDRLKNKQQTEAT